MLFFLPQFCEGFGGGFGETHGALSEDSFLYFGGAGEADDTDHEAVVGREGAVG